MFTWFLPSDQAERLDRRLLVVDYEAYRKAVDQRLVGPAPGKLPTKPSQPSAGVRSCERCGCTPGAGAASAGRCNQQTSGDVFRI